ncbi:gas vesicle protein [Paenibacillus montanisoli]|uniref:Gas vesicle protein n=1 Tax=Paenibacillus montanisoli TaxID=2081970 RepID=A0A328TXJ0_9BACL|nr:gas vesicle protein [Paenibacillus montanisoli]RAP75189.1 gas vesicle protein [Paenibacillus montanisoli]
MSVQHSAGSANLLEVLEKILDKGLVIAGDIKISLADVELLSIKIRLIVASVDKAKQIGIDWWEHDAYFSSQAKKLKEENNRLRDLLNDSGHIGD